MKYFMGVDLGISGGITIIDENGTILVCKPMPTTEIIVNKKKKNQYDIKTLDRLFDGMNRAYQITEVIMERLRPIPMQSSQTGFSLGMAVGIFRTLFTVYEIPYREVEPRLWQQEMFQGTPYDKDTTKEVSIMVANRLAPGFSFKATDRSKKESDGMTDSYNMAVYLKRVYK